MDTAQWPQGIGVVKPNREETRPMQEINKKPRPQKEQALNCPRCNSTHTKFCYYNNYSLSQPRYFCKTCRRYWTEGGSLRNVPVGGGSRKNKRPSSSSTIDPTSSKNKLPHLAPHGFPPQNPKIHETHDLNRAYPPPIPEFLHLSYNDQNALHQNQGTIFSNGLSLQEFKPSTLNFSLDGFSSGYGSLVQGVQESSTTSARMFFPFEELKPVSNPSDQFGDQNRVEGETHGYWSGVLGGGSW